MAAGENKGQDEVLMIIAGNWKMNLSRRAAVALVHALDGWANQARDAEIVIFPPAVLIPPVRAALGVASVIRLGGQDCHADAAGAHTGDISAEMLVDAGCAWVLAGHSERRQNHGETSGLVAAKASRACAEGLKPIICVGENLNERERGIAFDVVASQLRESLPENAGGIFGAIAYEPVWAIGTGKVASLEDIAAMHAHIRQVLASSAHGSGDIPVLYGGSVKPDNAAAILGLADVGGVLVGGASLKAEDFIAIITAATA